MEKPKKYPAFLIMGAIIALDQLTKYLVRLKLPLGDFITVGEKWFGQIFQLHHLQNTGAAFSLSLPNPMWNRAFFVVVSVFAVVFILWMLSRATNKIQVTAFGLVLGGAIGNNLIDRLLFGAVTDFISVDIPDIIPGMERFPVFNVADSAIFIAMCLLIIDIIFISGKKSPHKEPETSPDAETYLPDKEQ
ncbi:MAG: signal peptidase II [Candidatus Cloacimonadaceae bacterium]|jgi:signal peptidase II|nr:signal peptidase II [Candidatus Cloacimonadota bacterium]MDX9949692.1 signal peptidase II [Candidatus Syntrophosphaera sp.]NLN85156.1 signal peptidase II [Candidatus Cloacimonadota bacterium]